MDIRSRRPLAVVTGGSSDIGRELARLCVAHAFDLVLIGGSEHVHEVAGQLGADVAAVYSQRHDLSTYEGVEAAWNAIHALGRPVDALLLNAGVGVIGHFTSETDLEEELHMVRLNCDGVVHLAKRVLPGMVARASGRVLVTSSMTATLPGPYSAVYDASKAFDLSFAEGLRAELKECGVTVTAVQPGPKDDPALVASQAFDAMMSGRHKLYAGSWKSRFLGWVSSLLPEPTRVRMHRRLLA